MPALEIDWDVKAELLGVFVVEIENEIVDAVRGGAAVVQLSLIADGMGLRLRDDG